MIIKTTSCHTPAKINLYLEIKAKRPDGYHDIESVMQTVGIFDILTISRCHGEGQNISVECTDESLPCDETNLCHRAAKLFFDAAGIDSYNTVIKIEKHIPMAAGLGGGSSDAAAVLVLLNELYETAFTEGQLCELGSKIGADVPFCIVQGISVTRGIGDVFSSCARLPECYFVIACAGEGISTPWAYKRLDEMYDFDSRDVSAESFIAALEHGEFDRIVSEMTNIFETAVLPEREMARRIRDMLTDCGAEGAMMSGSGPSVFGVFKTEQAARTAVGKLRGEGIIAYNCKPYYPAK
ncbi:MAG: 4-(cytidine 5'-diphospho)-2-C-methyl-D-erythritol kinase [Clostridia bacterium]|nr:4-(cytidine 5'-diphospho)-2-C-methyl-D-erythritol kinase [Clostridia bacterium]